MDAAALLSLPFPPLSQVEAQCAAAQRLVDRLEAKCVVARQDLKQAIDADSRARSSLWTKLAFLRACQKAGGCVYIPGFFQDHAASTMRTRRTVWSHHKRIKLLSRQVNRGQHRLNEAKKVRRGLRVQQGLQNTPPRPQRRS